MGQPDGLGLAEWLSVAVRAERLRAEFLRTLAAVMPEGQAVRDLADWIDRDIAAKQAILDELDAMPHALDDGHHECPMVQPDMWRDPACTCGRDAVVDRIRRHLATVYADRDGWREEWRPT